MCFILWKSVNRLSKAQKNGARCLNSTILSLAVHCLREDGLRKKPQTHYGVRRSNESGCRRNRFLSLYKGVKASGKMSDLLRLSWLMFNKSCKHFLHSSAYIFCPCCINTCTSTIMDNVFGKWNKKHIQGIAIKLSWSKISYYYLLQNQYALY